MKLTANRSSANNPNHPRKCKEATVTKVVTEDTAVVAMEAVTVAVTVATDKVAATVDSKVAMGAATEVANRAAMAEDMVSNKVAMEAASVVPEAEVAADAEEDSVGVEVVAAEAVDEASNLTKPLSHLKIPITFVPAIFLTFSLTKTDTNTPPPNYDYDLTVY